MEEKIILMLENITGKLEKLEDKVEKMEEKIERNHEVSLEAIEKYGEDMTILNDKVDDVIMLLLKRNGNVTIREIIDITKPQTR